MHWEGGLRGWVLGWQQLILCTMSIHPPVDCLQTAMFGPTPSHQNSTIAQAS